jgi:hypothetical protein
MRKRFPPGFLIALAIAGLTVAGCGGAQPAAGARSVAVSPGKSASLHMASGLDVTIPADAVTGTGTLSGSMVVAPTPAPAGMTLTGGVYDLHLTGTELTGHAILTVPVPAAGRTGASAGPDAALLVYYDPATGRWQPVDASYNAATRTLTATTPHLSLWSVLTLDGAQVLNAARQELAGFLGAAGVGQPSCPGSSKLGSLGVTVTSDQGNLVKWCPDDGPSGPMLRIVNNRTYAVEADYPDSWSAQPLGSPDPVTAQLLAALPALSLRAGGPNVGTVIMPGGGGVALTPPAGQSGTVLISPSAEGIIFSAMLYAVDTLGMTYDDIPGTDGATPTLAARAIALAFKDEECVTQLDDVINDTPVTDAATAGADFRSLTDVSFGCLGAVWDDAFGLSGAQAAFDASVFSWLAAGVKLILEDGRALIDTAIYWQGYRIELRTPALTSPAGGLYLINRQLYAGGSLLVVLSHALLLPEQSGQLYPTFYVAYQNTGSTALTLNCTGYSNPNAVTLTLADGQVISSVDTYCGDHESQTVTLAPGQVLHGYAIFGTSDGLSQPFSFSLPSGNGWPGGTVSGLSLTR